MQIEISHDGTHKVTCEGKDAKAVINEMMRAKEALENNVKFVGKPKKRSVAKKKASVPVVEEKKEVKQKPAPPKTVYPPAPGA